MNSCFGCFSLRTGSIIVAVTEIIFQSCIVGYFGLTLAEGDEASNKSIGLQKRTAVILLGSGIIAIIFYVVLLIGVLMGKPPMIRIWVIFATFMVSLYIILLIIAVGFKLDIDVKYIIAGFLVCLIRIYSIIVVRSYSSERRRQLYEEYRYAIGPRASTS